MKCKACGNTPDEWTIIYIRNILGSYREGAYSDPEAFINDLEIIMEENGVGL